MKKFNIYILICFPILIGYGCKKQDAFLDAKPNEALATISTLAQCQLLLQDEQLFNTFDSSMGEVSSDDYYITTSVWTNLGTQEQNLYIFAKQIDPAGGNDVTWTNLYSQIYYANTVLDALPNITIAASDQTTFNNVKGEALFFRAIAFYNLVQTFALPYDPNTASTDLGIPLRLTSALIGIDVRASEQACYNQILQDLQTAVTLLPTVAQDPARPTQSAANGLLSRVYLAMGNYNQSLQYANAYLAVSNQLIDYNTVTSGKATNSFSTAQFVAEDIYHTKMYSYTSTITGYKSITDSTLYRSYTTNDLRKTLFFIITNGLPYFIGTYDNSGGNSGGYAYSGIATDEIYLTRAECNARLGNTNAAMTDLNTLLITRWKTGTFVPYTAISADDALQQILTERRKELLYRGLRWTDLRRLNKDSRFATTVTHIVNGVTYTLPPNSALYAMPIADNEISISGIQQNQR